MAFESVDIYSWSVIIFVLILAAIIYIDRKNLEIKYLLIMRKTKKGIKILDELAKYPKFWKIVGTLGIFVAIFLMSIGLISLIEFSRKIILGEIVGPVGGIVLPSPTKTTILGPGFIGLPFWIWIIILPVIMLPHEIFHGIMARVEKVKIKSFGVFLLAIFPGAFVEPNENQVKKLRIIKKLRIFVAGSFANFLVSLLLFTPFLNTGLIPNFIWPFFVSDGLYITSLNETAPAYKAGIPANSTLTHINGEKIKVTYNDYLSGTYLLKYLEKIKAGEEIILTVNEKNYSVIPIEISHNNITRPYVGVTLKPVVKMDEKFFFEFLIPLLTWMWILSFAVATINILPIYPLDGGHVFKSIIEKISKKHQNLIVSLVSVLVVGLLIFSIVGPYIIKIF